MLIMKLPLPSFGKKQPQVNYFLSLLLRDDYISAHILKEVNGTLHLGGKSEETLTQSIEHLTPQEWIEILDRVISKAEETLPANTMTHKTMFGVKENWVEETHIKKEYLVKLKKVCDALDLQPVGFLVVTEAIAHQLQEQEGAPLTAILVEIGSHQLTTSYIRAGKTIETQHSIIIGTPAQTVDALLKHFISATVLPSRIIIFDGGRTESLAQEFIAHQWSKSLPFLHMPQITPLAQGYDAQAVILGAAEQMGMQISGGIQPLPTAAQADTPSQPAAAVETKTPAQQFMQEQAENISEPADEEQLKDDAQEDITPEQPESLEKVEASSFGFIQERDIADVAEDEMNEQMPQSLDTSAQQENSLHDSANLSTPADNIRVPHEDISEEVNSAEKKPSVLLPVSRTYHRMITHLKSFSSHLPTGGGSMPRWLYILPVILIIIIAGIVWYILNVKATVQLTLKPKIVAEQGTVTFSTGSDNDFSNNLVASQDVSVSLDGSSTTNATGSKDVGTPAKGTVTIYNNDSSPQSLSSGTELTSSNNLVFTLDQDVTIASASGDIFSGTKPGTSDVTVTAKDIGTQYNLPSNMTFSISGGTSVAAKNSNAFSGGSKKTVTVVSQKDVTKLLTDLPNSLEAQAKQQMQSKITSGQSLLPDILSTSFANKTISPNVGQQASTVTLKANVTFHAASYNQQDLQNLDKILLKDKFTDNASLSDKGITSSITNDSVVDPKTIKATLNLQAGLLPHIDKSSLLSQVSGKSVTQATNLLQNEPQVESISIQLHPNIPLIPQILPRFSNHITIDIVSND